MIKPKHPNLLKDFGPANLELIDFFFGEKMVKINTFVSKDDPNKKFPVCYQMDKGELRDFILEAENYKEILKEDNELDRLIVGKDGDVISLQVKPLIIRDIYLDLKIEVIPDVASPTNPDKGVANLTILNYYKK